MGRAIISLMLVLVSAGLTPAAEAGGSGAGSLIQARDFSGLIGIPGFSNAMLNNHFKLYQGYVKNTNALMEKLESLRIEMKDKTPEYAELKRRLGWEWNGVRLHELYFENLGGKEPLGEDTALGKKLRESFGSIERWKNDFVSTGLMRGIGWVVAYWEPGTGKILNVWINEHDGGHIAGARPILVMDVFEHAYMPDYQLDRARYIDTFFRNIRWEAASDRFEKCMADSGVGVSAMEDLMREHGLLDRLLLIDEAILRHLDRNEAFPSEAIVECMDITRHL